MAKRYLTKTQARNKGEVTQYYIEDNHQGIVSKEIFDMVENEIQRRANLYCGGKKSKYSKYSLSGKVICGKCCSICRRVVWTGGGNRRVVWRCIERLNYGIKKCRYSPTIYEDTLHNAILNNIKSILKNTNDVKETVKREIEAVIFKENKYNPQVIRTNIRKYEKELNMLINILKETEDKEFYIEKIHTVESQIQ